MIRSRVVPSLLAGLTLAATLILSSAGSAAPAARMTAVPLLGSSRVAQTGAGFGRVKPRTVFLGGDPTGYFKDVTWHAWGKAEAIGHGTGYYPPPGQPVAAAVHVPVLLRASSLGACDGHLAYRRVKISFEYRGHIEPGVTLGICGQLTYPKGE
jgi:hypothetical protein